MPSCFAACRAIIPAWTKFFSAKIVSTSSRDLPGFRPFNLAASIPSFVCAEISRRSKWAMAPKTWKISSPAADVVSMRSSRLINPMFWVFRSSTVFKSSLRDRPSRSSRIMAKLSPVRAVLISGAVKPLAGNDIFENPNGTDFFQACNLARQVLLGS